MFTHFISFPVHIKTFVYPLNFYKTIVSNIYTKIKMKIIKGASRNTLKCISITCFITNINVIQNI